MVKLEIPEVATCWPNPHFIKFFRNYTYLGLNETIDIV